MDNNILDIKNRRLLWVVAVIVLVLLLVAVIIEKVCTCLPTWCVISLDILIALSSSAIAGLLVAILVDTPQLVRNFKGMLTEGLMGKSMCLGVDIL